MPTLNFKGKAVIETYHHTVPHHRLEFDAKLSLLPKGSAPSLDGNLIIEGDNLLALKALLPTHAGKVKCVYIDPPYNTGNEGWVYNDNLTQPQFKEWIGKTVGKEGEDATRHDKWCCMMYPRLQLLRELMTDDGSIWISIDDNEVQNLREIMDEIFGYDNFIATVIWEKVYSPKSSAKYLSENHDYIVAYAKNKVNWKRRLLPRTEEANARYENPDNDPRGPWKPSDLSARNYYSKGIYSIECPGGRVIPGPPEGTYWRVSEESFWDLDQDKRIFWGPDGNSTPAIKRFLSEVKDLVPETIWTYREVGHTQDAKKEVLRIMTSTEAPITPKPVDLLRRICWIASEPGDIVLDSFAGTGTTAHAVLEMNAEEKNRRRFVLVQQPTETKDDQTENRNICRTLTAERVRRVITGYDYVKRGPKGKKKEEHQAGLPGSFTYTIVGDPLFGEYRDLGDRLPNFQELAKYIFYTETSRQIDLKKVDEKSGFIGSTEALGGTSYYLLYTPNHKEDRELSTKTLDALLKKDKNRSWVIYCEKIWLHADQIRKFEKDHGKRVRPMVVPFNLK
ncbi:MAG TPA: site-specific DNA-methyltransferase [Tepidisphaeraceae bacterium]|nr:site-specific DNA-methyltransferase [Tepidisphaeraceae bacterium]